MSARSLIRKLKQFVGLADGTGSESDAGASAPEQTEVTVERAPDSGDETPDPEPAGAAEQDTTESADRESTDEDAGESVDKIKGIGPTYRDRLEAGGLETVAELADSDVETVADLAQTSEGRAEEWIRRARNR